jgi:hypothetical protein
MILELPQVFARVLLQQPPATNKLHTHAEAKKREQMILENT